MNIKIKQNVTRVLLAGSILTTTLTSSAFANEEQVFKNPLSTSSKSQSNEIVPNKVTITKEDKASFIRFVKYIEQAQEVNNPFSFEEYPIFIKALAEIKYLQGKDLKLEDLINNTMKDEKYAEWFKHFKKKGAFYRLVMQYKHPNSITKEDYEKALVEKQGKIMAASVEDGVIGETKTEAEAKTTEEQNKNEENKNE